MVRPWFTVRGTFSCVATPSATSDGHRAVFQDQEEEMRGERFGRICVLVLALAVLGAASAAWASEGSPYIQARVQFSSTEEWRGFLKLQDLDIMKSKPGVAVTIVTSPGQLSQLRALGYDVTVEVEDMEAHYASRIRGPNFGQFHTYSETSDFLDALHHDSEVLDRHDGRGPNDLGVQDLRQPRR
jgi:hypothetical protein